MADSRDSSEPDPTSSDVNNFAIPLLQNLRPGKTKSNMRAFRFVSSWHMPMVERNLKIKFKNVVSWKDVLTKGGINLDLTEKHRQYKEHLKNLLDFSLIQQDFRLFSSRLKEQFKKMKEKVLNCEDFKSHQRDLVRFIQLLHDLCERGSRNDPEFEGSYTELVSRFAEVCLLMAYNHPTTFYWPNFLGKQGLQVSGKPDLRLYKHGFQRIKSEQISFCVVEVKRDEDDCKSCRRKKPKLDLQSSSSDDQRQRVKPTREDRLKGQHIGELLLELHNSLENKFDDKCTEYSMPGLLIDGTMASVSMLVISKGHYEKLKDGTPLDETDEAFVYCSTYYNILIDYHREELIEVFLLLDNMPE